MSDHDCPSCLAARNAHSAYIETRTPGPVKVAVCSCGWQSGPHVTSIAAIKERTAHLERWGSPRAPRAQEEARDER